MGFEIEYIHGQTPLDEEEKESLLIETITTRGDLDEFEQLNIQQAVQWTISRKFKTQEIITEGFVKILHYKMFYDVWAWAGKFRSSNKNMGVDRLQISVDLRTLLDDCKYWIDHTIYSPDEVAVRFKHRIVQIHCFPNGNGRHSRLIADVVMEHVFKKPVFSWGSGADLVNTSEARTQYIKAIHDADKGNIRPLIEFARS